MKFILLTFIFSSLSLYLGMAIHRLTRRFFLSCCLNLIFWHIMILLLFQDRYLRWVLIYAVLGLYGALFDFVKLKLEE